MLILLSSYLFIHLLSLYKYSKDSCVFICLIYFIPFFSKINYTVPIVVALISEFPITPEVMTQNSVKIWTVTVLEKWIDAGTWTILLPPNTRDVGTSVKNNQEADPDRWVSYYCKIISPTYGIIEINMNFLQLMII